MKEIHFDKIYSPRRDNKKVCESVASELMCGETHVAALDIASRTILEIDCRIPENQKSSGLMMRSPNNAWRMYCRKNKGIFNEIDLNTETTAKWFGIHKNE